MGWVGWFRSRWSSSSVGEGEGLRTDKTAGKRNAANQRPRERGAKRLAASLASSSCLPAATHAAIKSWHHYLTGFPSSSSPEICLRIASIFRWANEEQQMSAASLARSLLVMISPSIDSLSFSLRGPWGSMINFLRSPCKRTHSPTDLAYDSARPFMWWMDVCNVRDRNMWQRFCPPFAFPSLHSCCRLNRFTVFADDDRFFGSFSPRCCLLPSFVQIPNCSWPA